MRATTLAVSLIFIVLFNRVSFAVNTEDIVGIWLLDEGKGDFMFFREYCHAKKQVIVAADSSDHKRDGQKMDAANWVKGKFGNALDFSASQASRVDVPDEPTLDLITFSITAWVNIGKTGTWEGEIMVNHKNGNEFPILLTTSIVRNQKGEPIAMIGIIKDITKRRKMEKKLRGAEKKLTIRARELLESNAALKVLLKLREQDQKEFENNILSNIKYLIMPYMERVKK